MKKIKLTQDQYINGTECKAGTVLTFQTKFADLLITQNLAVEFVESEAFAVTPVSAE